MGGDLGAMVNVVKGNTGLQSLLGQTDNGGNDKDDKGTYYGSLDDVNVDWVGDNGAKRETIDKYVYSNAGSTAKVYFQYRETASDGTQRVKACIRLYRKKNNRWKLGSFGATFNMTHLEHKELFFMLGVHILVPAGITEKELAERHAILAKLVS